MISQVDEVQVKLLILEHVDNLRPRPKYPCDNACLFDQFVNLGCSLAPFNTRTKAVSFNT